MGIWKNFKQKLVVRELKKSAEEIELIMGRNAIKFIMENELSQDFANYLQQDPVIGKMIDIKAGEHDKIRNKLEYVI